MSLKHALNIATTLTLFTFTAPALAVDGYKNLKFGMTVKEVATSDICTFRPAQAPQAGVTQLNCHDFAFGDHTTSAAAFFIDAKFLRFGFEVPMAMATELVEMLADKYGPPSFSPSNESLVAIETIPNSSVFVGFDNDTVLLTFFSDEFLIQSASLIYTSPDYNVLLRNKIKTSVSNDL